MAWRKKPAYPTCSKCDTEINPNMFDGCEKYYIVGDEVMCADCFKEYVMDWIETNLDDVAAAMKVPVVEVCA